MGCVASARCYTTATTKNITVRATAFETDGGLNFPDVANSNPCF